MEMDSILDYERSRDDVYEAQEQEINDLIKGMSKMTISGRTKRTKKKKKRKSMRKKNTKKNNKR